MEDAISRKPNCIDCIHKSVCFRLDMRVDSDYAEKCGDFLKLEPVTVRRTDCENCSRCEDAFMRGHDVGLENGYKQGERDARYESVTQKSGKWILISDELPEDGTWNLFTDGKCVSVERYKSDAMDHFYPSGRWFSLDEAIAWMPLPKPYESQESER